MLWIVANLYFDPTLHLKVREALARRVVPKGSSDYSLFSLSWLGYVAGAAWDYTLSGGLYGNGSTHDSVLAVMPYDTIGTCYKPGTQVAAWVSIGTADSGAINDTSFTYFDGTLYGEGGVMVAKYNAASGDTWEAWDTCLLALNTRFPIGDVDGDATVDSAWVVSSQATVDAATSTNLAVGIYPLNIRVWASAFTSYGVDSIVIKEYDRHIFRINYGKVGTHTDSVRYTYIAGSAPVLDTLFPDFYHKVMNVSVSERPSVGYSVLTLRDGVVDVTYVGNYTLSIYSSTGRLVRRYFGRKKASYPLPSRKGVYFVVFRSKDRALIRPYVR